MENQIQQNEVVSEIRVYNPRGYVLIGFLFCLIPVFIMSLLNSKVLPNGEEIKKRMKIYLYIYVIGILVLFAVAYWIIYDLYHFYPSGGCKSTPYGTLCASVLPPKMSDTFVNTVLYSKYIFFGFNLILLILVYRFSRAVELPLYLQLKESGRLVSRGFLLPVLAGVVFSIIVYVLLPDILIFFGELAV